MTYGKKIWIKNLKSEKLSILYLVFFLIVLLSVSIALEVYIFIFLLGLFSFSMFCFYGFIPAYRRANYIKTIGYYGIGKGVVFIYDSNGVVDKEVQFSNANVKLIENGKYHDVELGDRITDMLSSLGGRGIFKFAVLCKLENAREMVDFLIGSNSDSKFTSYG